MSLSRKLLASMGIEEDKIDQIISGHSETVNALKDERDTFRGDAEKLASTLTELTAVKNELANAKAELESLKDKPEDEYKGKFESLKAEFEKYKADVEAEKTIATKKAAYTEICKDAGLSDRGVEKAVKYADWDTVELDNKGKVKGAKDHIKALKEDWAEYVVTETTKGAKTSNPPGDSGSGATMSIEEIMAITDTAARQQAIAQNHELFGF